MEMSCRGEDVGGGVRRSLGDADDGKEYDFDAKGSPFDGNLRSMPTLWRRQALPWLLEAGITLRCVRIELRICRSGGRTGLFCNDCNVLSLRWLSPVV